MFRNYVKEYLDNGGTLDSLQAEFGIRSKVYSTPDGDLVIFSYSHIDSPKTPDVVRMCRGLVLEKDTWKIVCYPFNRFYDYDEVIEERKCVNWKHAVATEKIDGSLLCVWEYKSKWYISTRTTIGGDNTPSQDGITFTQLFEKALLPFTRDQFISELSNEFCYVFEIVSPSNRVITPYEETKLYLIGCRCVKDKYDEVKFISVYDTFSSELKEIIKRPKAVSLYDPEKDDFIGMDILIGIVNAKEATDEGFVITDFSGLKEDTLSFPRIKLKGTGYKFLHNLKGSLENKTPNLPQMLMIVHNGQHNDILQAFPQFTNMFKPVEEKYTSWRENLESVIQKEVYAKFWSMNLADRLLPQNRKEFFQTLCNEEKAYSGILPVMYLNDISGIDAAVLHMCSIRSSDSVFENIWESIQSI